ncbi:MAG: hypothetical protein WCO89_13165 [Syntrophus sp. (in: bacteria)]
MDDFLKSPDAALRCILRPCGVRQVRLSPQYLRVLPADLFKKPSMVAFFILEECILKEGLE